MLTEWLPTDSAAHRAELGHHWTREDTWFAREAANSLRKLLVLTANINRDKGRSALPMPPDLPYPPGVPGEDDESEEVAAIRAEMDQTRARIFARR